MINLPKQFRFRIKGTLLALLGSLFFACSVAQPTLEYEVVESYPHNPGNFTQGLMFYQGVLYEGTGQRGDSRLIRYRDDYQTPLYTRPLPNRYFGEGIAVHKELLYQLTWQSELGFIFNPEDLSPVENFNYIGEGWGLTSNGEELWMSNGSSSLLQISEQGEIIQSLQIRLDGAPLDKLNELEWVEGYIAANRWYDNHIYFIDPQSGEVKYRLDLSDLAKPQQSRSEKVLNGIAWHPQHQTLWVTGKYWNRLYELEIDI